MEDPVTHRTLETSDHDLLIRIDERTSTFGKLFVEQNQHIAAHEKRLADIEQWRSNLMGRLAVLLALGAILGSVISQLAINWLAKT